MPYEELLVCRICDPKERLAKGLAREEGGRRDGRPVRDPEERLAKGLAREGGGRRDGPPALRRINIEQHV